MANVVPSSVIDGSDRSTSEPAIVPVTVPSKCTADASSVDCSERATISLGSVTWDAGIGGASGPTPSTCPAPTTTSATTPTTARPLMMRRLVDM